MLAPIIKVKSLKLATESNADGVLYITKKDPSKLDSLKMQYEMKRKPHDTSVSVGKEAVAFLRNCEAL